jgi:threonine/homoserine/homoserine lactone efflux protein
VLDFSVLVPFIIASLVITITPGPDIFLLIRNTLRSGTKIGFITMAGIFSGVAIIAGLMISGVGLIVSQSETGLMILQIAGGGYLLYLGLGSAWQARRLVKSLPNSTQEPEIASSKTSPYLTGLFTNLTNPKVVVFFVAFFPQFLGNAESVTYQLIFLTVIFVILAAGFEVLIVLAAGRMRKLLSARRFQIGMEITVSVVFVALALSLLAGSI